MRCNNPTCVSQSTPLMILVKTDSNGKELTKPYWECSECKYRLYVLNDSVVVSDQKADVIIED